MLYRAPHAGQTAEINVTQLNHVTAGNDLIVPVGQRPNSQITISALNLTTGGTGLALDRSINGWESRDDIDKAVGELDRATQRLRSAGTELATGLNILTTRESFTKEFADVLMEGSNKLTLLDQNEEGSTLLMLETRQQLGTTALSLANQTQQSILKLF